MHELSMIKALGGKVFDRLACGCAPHFETDLPLDLELFKGFELAGGLAKQFFARCPGRLQRKQTKSLLIFGLGVKTEAGNRR